MNKYTGEYVVGEDYHLRQIGRVQSALERVKSGLMIKIGDLQCCDIGFMALTNGLLHHKYHEGDTVTIKDCVANPTVLHVKQGSTFTVKNIGINT